MKLKIKKSFYALLLISCALFGCFLWQPFRSVEIIAVHQRNNYSDVLVRNFPFTDKGKISWWLKNKAMLKDYYSIPKPASYGGFDVTFWNFGDGYKEEGKYDRLCFDDMKTRVNCIDKDPVFTIKRFNYENILFITYEGRYKLKGNGEIIKVKRE